MTDPNNCGACGMACSAEQVCASGSCASGCGDASLTACSGSCVNLQSDAANCGQCGAACEPGNECQGGSCSCAGGDTCGGACVDTMTDSSNCGSCGNACAAGNVCSGGGCDCPAGQALCNGTCIGVLSNTQNCGSCGNACGLGQSCAAGACSCPDTQEYCGTGCVTVASTALHCGACDNACPSGVCNDGTCAPLDSSNGVIGWASVDGNTTGAGAGSSVDIANVSEFNTNATGSTARVLRITQNLSGMLKVSGSNKTIIGASAGITINGGMTIENSSNIIVRNLIINGKTSDEDGMTIDSSDHIWIDHCEFVDGYDGNLDIKNQSDYITVVLSSHQSLSFS
jgi:hypothetical protein